MNINYHSYLSTVTCLLMPLYLFSSEKDLDQSFETKLAEVTQQIESTFKAPSTRAIGYPLHHAIANNQNEAFHIGLAQPNCDINELSPQGAPPLGLAAYSGKLRFVQQLLRHKRIAVNTTDKKGFTALHAAAIQGHKDILHLLLSDPRTEVSRADSVEGFTPLHSVIREGHVELMQPLLSDPRVEVNRTDNKYGLAPLHLAVITGQETMIGQLFTHPQIDVNMPDNRFWCTPLFFTTLQGNTPMAQLFLSHKDTNVNHDFTSNYTPLRAALLTHNIPLALTLIQHGAENDIDKNGKSCLDLVKDASTKKTLLRALIDQEDQREEYKKDDGKKENT